MNRTTNLLLIATILVASLLLTLPVWAASASINGEVFVAAGTTGTNALPSSRTTNVTVLVQSNAGDGTNAFRVNAATTHTSGNLVEVQNNSTNKFTIDYLGNVSTPGSVSADGGAFTNTLTLNGVTVSTFNGTSGTVINTGTPAVGNVPVYSDTTGTNVSPTSALTLTGTNASLTGVLTANGGAFTNTLTLNGSTVSTASAANPTATIGLSAVNGSAATFLRSDGAPALPSTGGAYAGAILIPWVDTNNNLTLTWKKPPQVWEFANANVADWGAFTFNSGSGGAPSVIDGIDIGVFSVGTGTLTNGGAGYRLTSGGVLFGTNNAALLFRVKTPLALSTDADGYELYVGFGDATTDAAPVDGAYIYYHHSVNSGAWLGRTVNNSVVTAGTGGGTVTVVADTWYSLLVEANNARVNFWASSDDGVSWAFIGSSVSNIPTTIARASGIEVYIRKVGGSVGTTARTGYIGRCEFWPSRN